LEETKRRGRRDSCAEEAAESAILARAEASAEHLRSGFVATSSFRLTSINPDPEVLNCEAASGVVVWGLEGEAVCLLGERRVQKKTCEIG
jgi:hypothetical protein